jgi:hypothetical protein
MSIRPSAGSNRRDFFRGAVRYGLLSALAGVAALTGMRGRLKGQRCLNRGICGGCIAFAGCGLPQALSVKAFRGGDNREAFGKES